MTTLIIYNCPYNIHDSKYISDGSHLEGRRRSLTDRTQLGPIKYTIYMPTRDHMIIQATRASQL